MSHSVRVVTWNLKYPDESGSTERVRHIAGLDWDVLLLQEVTVSAMKALGDAGLADGSAYGIELVTGPIDRRHGVAVLTRAGFEIARFEPIPDLPKPERGLGAVVRMPSGEEFRAVSWHAPNTVGDGVEGKMAGYAAILSYLEALDGPTILGFDGNHWNLSTDLEPIPVPERGCHEYYLEDLFFCIDPPHRLRDTYLDHLSANPEEYERILEERPGGPLAVTYTRGSRQNPQPDWFDYIFVSRDFLVDRCRHGYEEAVAVGSDHATVHADLTLER